MHKEPPSCGDAASAPSPAPLLPPHGQELRVGGEDLRHGLLELPVGLDQTLHFLDPCVRNALHALLAPHQEGERPAGVPLPVLGAMAGGLTAAAVGQRKGTGQPIGRDAEATQEFELAWRIRAA